MEKRLWYGNNYKIARSRPFLSFTLIDTHYPQINFRNIIHLYCKTSDEDDCEHHHHFILISSPHTFAKSKPQVNDTIGVRSFLIERIDLLVIDTK